MQPHADNRRHNELNAEELLTGNNEQNQAPMCHLTNLNAWSSY